MATNVAHEKPESEEQPTVKKLRIHEETSSIEYITGSQNKGETSELAVERSEEVASAFASGVVTPKATGTPKAAGTPKAVAAVTTTPKATTTTTSGFGGFGGFASSSSSGFSGFAATSSSSSASSSSSGFASFAITAESSAGFSGFAKTAESGAGFASFAKADETSEGFGEAASADFDPDSEENTAEFTPVVTLTEAEIANGEEEERVIVEKRSKLFKLVGKDYVEVGVGPFRVLKPRDAHNIDEARASARMVMRRESYPRGPGTKLILNARLTACVSSVKKSEKSLMIVIVEAASDEAGDASETADVTTTATATATTASVKPVTYLLRFNSQEDLLVAQNRIVDLLPLHASSQ